MSGLSGLLLGLSVELSGLSCLFVWAVVRAVCGVVRAVLFVCPGRPGCCPGCPGCGGSEVFWGSEATLFPFFPARARAGSAAQPQAARAFRLSQVQNLAQVRRISVCRAR